MGKVAGQMGLGVGFAALGIASGGAGWFTSAFWKQAGIMAVSSFLGAKLSPGQSGPRLEDTGVQLAQEGADFPRGWGRYRQAGTLAWCPGLDEHREKSSAGKGGPSVTEYKYSASAFIIGGAGPITRVERIRLNERIAYDYNGGNEKPFSLVQQGDVASGAWKWVKQGDAKVRIYPGTLNQPVDTWIESSAGLNQWTNYPFLWGAFFENCNLDKYGSRLPNATFDVYNAQTDLAAVVGEICALRGYGPDELDLYELEGTSIAQSEDEGYFLASRRAASAAVDELGFLFNFSLREQNGVLQAIRRGRVAVAVLGGRDILARADNEATQPLEERMGDEFELPNVEEVAFGDAGRESNPGVRRAVRTDARDIAPPGARGGRKTQSSVTAKMRGGRALRAGQIHLHERWAARESFPLSLHPRWLALAAGDAIEIETPDGPREVVLPQLNQPFFGAIATNSVVQDRLLYLLPIPADGGDATTSPLPDSPETPIGFVADCVALDSDDPDMVSKAFVLLAATQIEGRKWRGASCEVEKGEDADDAVETTWKKDYDIAIQSRATMGYLRTAWTPSTPEEGETTSSPIPARLYEGELHSASASRAHNGANILVFETGLVVSFRTATPGTGALDFDVSGLICGRYGSDYAEAGIENRSASGARAGLQLAANTKFVLFRDEEGALGPGLFVTGFGTAIMGQKRRFSFVPQGADDPQNHAQRFVLDPLKGRSFEPLSPVTTATRLGDGGVRLQGHARTRHIESNTDNPTRLSERPTAQGFRFRITLASGTHSGTLEKFSSDPMALFDFSLSASEITGIVSRSAADVAAEALTGNIALWGENGFGRVTAFSL